MPSEICYRSFAKINLYLDVVDKRRDGYHDIETIFQTIDLSDTLSFEERRSRITLECSTPDLDSGESNLVHQAATLLKEHTGCRLGARIHLEKRIPIAAGLAGGSGNAASTLVALNTLWDLKLPPARIRALALELGSDVPYCTLGGTAAATRRGEELTALPPLAQTWFVLIHPRLAVSASRVYSSPKLKCSMEKRFAGRTRSFRRAIRQLGEKGWTQLLFNRMEAPVFADHPHLAEAKGKLLGLGCLAAAMSGSGPTLFGVCKDKREAVRIADALEGYDTSVVSSINTALERAD
ncbi:MAG: 4-(cytidine 5'-diphospho)-2-C-methyl-D-erythritol kinase [Nitrospiraceae bacterium]|nr:4-(cytidine 5'-diphospho)-2-C-methyl-D-erythritol kinase [Nitrospiraceae bacterium]